jgi:hypothetical protein
MFLKQFDQFLLQYYSFKAENIAKQQKCRELWQYAWRHRLQLCLDCDVRKFLHLMHQLSFPPALQARFANSKTLIARILCHANQLYRIGFRPVLWSYKMRNFGLIYKCQFSYLQERLTLRVQIINWIGLPEVHIFPSNWQPNRVLGHQFPVCNTKWLKIANFARLYYQHFTTFRNETLEYY